MSFVFCFQKKSYFLFYLFCADLCFLSDIGPFREKICQRIKSPAALQIFVIDGTAHSRNIHPKHLRRLSHRKRLDITAAIDKKIFLDINNTFRQ